MPKQNEANPRKTYYLIKNWQTKGIVKVQGRIEQAPSGLARSVYISSGTSSIMKGHFFERLGRNIFETRTEAKKAVVAKAEKRVGVLEEQISKIKRDWG